jgi:hypothetical protein
MGSVSTSVPMCGQFDEVYINTLKGVIFFLAKSATIASIYPWKRAINL